MSNNLEKAQKAFAFFISSDTAEGEVAFDKLSKLGVSLDDVAYQCPDGSWLTRYGSIQFDMGQQSVWRSASSVEADRQSAQQEACQRAEAERQRQYREQEARQRAEAERQRQCREQEARRATAERIQKEYEREQERIRQAEHKHYQDIIHHTQQQYANHEAFNRGQAYVNGDGEYIRYDQMTWK